MKPTAKRILLLILSLSVFASFAGCTDFYPDNGFNAVSTGKPAGDEVERQTIRVATTFTGEDPFTPVWQQVLQDFRAGHPDIEVVDEATGAGGDTFKTKIYTDFASGNEPDVTYGYTGALGKPIIDTGKVISWEGELAADPVWASPFKKEFLEACKFEGKLYALPFLGYFEGMWVNGDLFRKNGMQVPKTYEDILEAIPVLREAGITPIACAFSDEPHYIIETFLLSMAGPEGHGNLYDPSWASALRLIKELYDKKAFTEDALTIKQGACVELFTDKKAAMLISGSWSQGKFKDYENTVVIPLPAVPGGKADPTDIIGGTGTGWYLVGDLNSRKNGAGMTFVKYMTRPEVVARFAATAGVPLIECGRKAGTPTEQSGIDMMNHARSISGAVGDALGQEVFGALWHGLLDVAAGRKTPEQVLENTRKLAEAQDP